MTTNPTYNANIDVNSVVSKKVQIAAATDYVLGALKREIGTKSVLIVIDASRNDIYADTIKESNAQWVNHMLKQKTMQFGFSFMDLTDVFKDSFEIEHVRFEWPYDGHWNEKGHEVVANALYKRLRTVERDKPL
jgi:hypothetical protein